MNQYRNPGMFDAIPLVVKNLLIINLLVLIASITLPETLGIDLYDYGGLYPWASEKFRPYQLVTYMFMHSPTSMTHILLNMFVLWMFGRVLEQVWGPKRFLIYYMASGIGAGIIQMLATHMHLVVMYDAVMELVQHGTPQLFEEFINDYIPEHGARTPRHILSQWAMQPEYSFYKDQALEIAKGYYLAYVDLPTVGASGSVYGVLLAFGMLFPNAMIMLLIPPIPMKAKYMVIGLGILELYMGYSNNPADNVAHFAHLGGMLFGYLLIRYWRANTTNFY